MKSLKQLRIEYRIATEDYFTALDNEKTHKAILRGLYNKIIQISNEFVNNGYNFINDKHNNYHEG